MKLKTLKSKPKPEFWNFFKNGITQSLIAEFLTCPERVHLSMSEGWTPVKTTGALAFGSMFHKVLELIYAGENINTVIKKIENEERKKLQNTLADEEKYDQLEETLGLIESVSYSYINRWEKNDSEMNWVSLEQIFEIPFNEIKISGKIDGIVSFNNKNWLFETKTKARIDDTSILDKLPFDFQVGLYLWAMWKLTDKFPAGVIYNLIRRPQLRKKQKETLPEFIRRVKQDVISRPDFYFIRYTSSITPEDIFSFEKRLITIIEIMSDWFKHKRRFKNSYACNGIYGPCKFLPICGRNDFSYFIKRENIFPELIEITEE